MFQTGHIPKEVLDNILTMAEMHRLESYWIRYGDQLPSDFDTLYAKEQCDSCGQRNRGKKISWCPTQRLSWSNLRSQYIWQTYLIMEENRWICI